MQLKITNEPAYDKTNKMTCAPSEDSAQPGLPPRLIWVSLGTYAILLFFVMRWLKYVFASRGVLYLFVITSKCDQK